MGIMSILEEECMFPKPVMQHSKLSFMTTIWGNQTTSRSPGLSRVNQRPISPWFTTLALLTTTSTTGWWRTRTLLMRLLLASIRSPTWNCCLTCLLITLVLTQVCCVVKGQIRIWFKVNFKKNKKSLFLATAIVEGGGKTKRRRKRALLSRQCLLFTG